MSTTEAPASRSPLVAAQFWLAEIYNRLATPANVHALERLMVILAALGFLVHLLLIWAAGVLAALAPLRPLVGTNLLSALYTPFSAILFYELLLLVLSIPASTTLALGRQFEIISLITIRNVFKDLAEFETLAQIETQTDTFSKLMLDMGGGVLLFLLVGIFYHVNRWRAAPEPVRPTPSPALALFIVQKKIVALGLSGLFFILLGVSVWRWGFESFRALSVGGALPPTLTTIFYADIFSVLVFADVLLLILSLLLSDSYPLVFRNAGFVASTILLRISIAAGWPYSLLAALAAVGFGISVNLIYKYSSGVAPSDAGG